MTLSVDARGLGRNRFFRDYSDNDPYRIRDLSIRKRSSEPNVANVDYCAKAAEAASDRYGVVPYEYAKGCYKQFPFDSRIRDDTIDSVKANLEAFYVFYDIAKYPLDSFFSMSKRYILTWKPLTQHTVLRNTTYANDYSFHASLSQMIAQLQDPHTSYKNMCYQQFLFIQPMSTYGVFEDGRQQVKVATVLNKLDLRLTSSLVDCEVTHIDGHPAFQFITDYAETKSYSKDRGVRLNKAFSYLAHDKTGSAFDRYSLGTFAQRTSIPSNATVEYEIDCSAKLGSKTAIATEASTTPIRLSLAWSALDATMVPYNDALSFKAQFCTNNSIQTVKKFVLDTALPDDFDVSKVYLHGGRKKSRELYRGPYASFHLLSDGATAVFRLGTESPNVLDSKRSGFYDNIDRGFASMEAAGATKVIIDLQNNSGGIICWGRYVLQTLFPQTVDAPYLYNLRASRLAQALAQATFAYEQSANSPYEGLVDPETGSEVEDDSWMIPGITLPGRQGVFSKKVTDRFCSVVEEIKGSEDDTMFNPENIVILTNGFCGSTCAVLALQLHERYGVRTVAIGGHHGQSMTFASFPGGAVQANNTQWVHRVQNVYSTLPSSLRTKELDAAVPKKLPSNGQFAFTFREVMSASAPERVSEYMRIPSEFRMDYTSSRFRMPSVLWEDVRQEVWGDQEYARGISTTGQYVKNEDGEGEEGEEDKEEEESRIGVATVVLVDGGERDLTVFKQFAVEADREDVEWLEQHQD
ncbi:hypothetical protein BG004_006745 [Podila humilis]|nr:hypothetical protein BG004_006745 [Podila humilis]